jgi:8-oxo-dGTP pyrophosphatase MutT (NUDIX family)
MTHVLTKAWEEILKPILFRPKRLQMAALCYRRTQAGVDVLLVTSRGTGRWILPKGWPIDGKNGAQSALQEAWEEAGVKKADIESAPIGSYDYIKHRDNGTTEPVEILVYTAQVQKLATDYPEAHERRRQWLRAEDAANLVNEPQLQALLRQL